MLTLEETAAGLGLITILNSRYHFALLGCLFTNFHNIYRHPVFLPKGVLWVAL